MRFRNGLPRQCAHWLAMTGFFDSLNHPKGGFSFCDYPQVLLFAPSHIARKGECEGETFAGFPTRVQSPARRRPILRSKIAAPKRKTTQRVVFLFGAGDEARTRYLDLGKVALYQMSYARKRKIDYTSHRSVCQPRFPNFRKKLMPALAGGHAGIYRMMISTTPGLSALG